MRERGEGKKEVGNGIFLSLLIMEKMVGSSAWSFLERSF